MMLRTNKSTKNTELVIYTQDQSYGQFSHDFATESWTDTQFNQVGKVYNLSNKNDKAVAQTWVNLINA